MNSIGGLSFYNFARFPKILDNIFLSPSLGVLKMLPNRKIVHCHAKKKLLCRSVRIYRRLKKMCKHYQRDRKSAEKMQI